ncbi:interferon-induced very large GTPase 1-like [Trichomycterus rosablanca]|uniref:interferon-induced very large GTPase 1-like n=1 Tax=Trichomycterus rosablanca TaxID=2290929 RepID=UPI002F35E872
MAQALSSDGHKDTTSAMSEESNMSDPKPLQDNLTEMINVGEGPEGTTSIASRDTDMEPFQMSPKRTKVTSESSQAEGHIEGPDRAVQAFQEDGKAEMHPTGSEPLSPLTVVLFGKTTAIKFGSENVLLGPDHVHPTQVNFPLKAIVSGRHLSVIDMMDLHENALYLDPVEHITGGLVRENNIHSFILVLELDNITESDKLKINWLQGQFGEDVLPYVMVLFTYDREEEEGDSIIDDLMKDSFIEQITEKCGGRYCTCSKSMSNQVEMKTLLEKIELMVQENTEPCYTAEMYNAALTLRNDVDSKRQLDARVKTMTPKENSEPDENKKSQEPEWGIPGCGKPQREREEKKAKIQQLFRRLNLGAQNTLTSDLLTIRTSSVKTHKPVAEKDLVYSFLEKLLMMDYKARCITFQSESPETKTQPNTRASKDICSALFKKKAGNSSSSEQSQIHPMDIQMAAFHSSDNFLRQLMVTKLSQCQYAVPLIIPNPFTGEIELPLWALRQIKKSWMSVDGTGKTTSKCKPMFEVETPMVAFLRLGSLSSSKSQLMNNLINKRHDTFFHRNCLRSSKTRLLMDGVVEIAWYCPSGGSDWLNDCTAFCNLHGDAGNHSVQREMLTQMATVNVVLLSTLGEDDGNRKTIEKLSESPKPLIFLLTDSDSDVEELWEGKYSIGLKGRSQSDVAEELKLILHKCCTHDSQSEIKTFKLEDVAKLTDIVVDEENEECQKAKNKANQTLSLLNQEKLTTIKEKHLPCQGKLWHDWCQKNKNLYHLIGHPEEHKTTIKQQMTQIRSQQHELAFSPLIKMFSDHLRVLEENERQYFLKWLGIVLDSLTSDQVSALLHAYDEQWSMVSKQKQAKSPVLDEDQAKLEEISKDLNAVTFGVEHLLREMGQIYESFKSTQSTKGTAEHDEAFCSLPRIAAEIMLSGYPLELMDGDAGHVPLIWVPAVIDELIKKVGDKRVFVLSVLGIQSSGKSTMLNAMFGLQFAVSAGRCTRGAFMQLVRVSDEMDGGQQFDYILVVDTEGLRALELDGKTTLRHDNELATFVVGLGNLTLINIFGENPADMQDILQIVVQAFLRMKKVRLSPSCMFVHQNVGDISAGEKTMEGRRRLQEKLDEMTKLAAKEEECDAECFSDIIAFDVKKDVGYFAQLWEGNPPMAPPNPKYSENVHEMKQMILSKISTNRGMTLSEFKLSIKDLWKALLNENFVFSFRNTLEIAVYRRLEHEYSKWTWSLRSAMLAVENKLYNRVSNEASLRIDERHLAEQIKDTKEEVDRAVGRFFSNDGDKEILIQWRERFQRKIKDLYSELVERTKEKLDHVCRQKVARERLDVEKKNYENKLFNLSKELACGLKNNDTDEDALKSGFDDVWSKWVTELNQDAPSVVEIDVMGDVTKILSETYELALVCERQNLGDYCRLDVLGNYSDYVIFKKLLGQHEADEPPTEDEKKKSGMFNQTRRFITNAGRTLYSAVVKRHEQTDSVPVTEMLSFGDNDQLRALVKETCQQTDKEVQRMSSEGLGYNHSYIQQIIQSVKTSVGAHETKTPKYLLKKEFTVDLCLHACSSAGEGFSEIHKEFKEANDIRMYLEKQKPQYFNIFKNLCSGATSTTVFGTFIVDKLEPSILQTAYDKTALDVTEKMKRNVPAFRGNRSNLEKHILTSLALEENFEDYIAYLHKPKEYFASFITKEVDKYLLEEKTTDVLETLKSNIRSTTKFVIDSVKKVTEEANNRNGDVNTWLQLLSTELKDELQFKEESYPEQKEITDLHFLQDVVNKHLAAVRSKLSADFQQGSDLRLEMFRKKPNEAMIEHLCQCCWAQCPFCSAICTNTLEGHSGDHDVRFHRNCGINGWSFMFKNNLGLEFCTTAVSSDNLNFRTEDKVFKYKDYRKAGGEYDKWNICRDDSEMPYWKWFVCTFQENLEKHFKKKFTGIPQEWKNCTRDRAIESLSEL